MGYRQIDVRPSMGGPVYGDFYVEKDFNMVEESKGLHPKDLVLVL